MPSPNNLDHGSQLRRQDSDDLALALMRWWGTFDKEEWDFVTLSHSS